MSRIYDSEFKDKVAREALRVNNIAGTARKNGVNPNSVRKWVNNLKGNSGGLELQVLTELDDEKDLTFYKRENNELKRQLEAVKKDLSAAVTLIGEKDLYIKKIKDNSITNTY
ncbi:transposase [Niallia taxi]|uniref:transposase n=1 Tax=Niallia taxi TaxID=2499688 RepID=UPI002E1EDF61|nr:transposase [Niallia taxi]MED4039399.1 transposase [Niallia taxi]